MLQLFEEVLRNNSSVDLRPRRQSRQVAKKETTTDPIQNQDEAVNASSTVPASLAPENRPFIRQPRFSLHSAISCSQENQQEPKVELTKVELRFLRHSFVLYCDQNFEPRESNLSTTRTADDSVTNNLEDDEDDLFYIFDPSLPVETNEVAMNVEQYAAKRVMTKTQEKWNAITMVPPSLYCIYFLLSAAWIRLDPNHPGQDSGFASQVSAWIAETTGCLESSSWFVPPAVPPLTVLAVVAGTCLHLPFSFVYHWKYAHQLTGTERINHWSRRMDQSMIHFNAAMLSFASSGSLRYFLVCALFNLDCARHHFQPYFRPLSNQLRVAISIFAYSIPLVVRGDWDKFGLFWLIWGLAIWLFSQYPVGGWSHSAFHLSVALLAPLMMSIAIEMPASQPQIQLAAQCLSSKTVE